MATIAEDAAIDEKFTQKMGGCQSKKNPLQGSDHRFVHFSSIGEDSGSESKGEIR